MLIFIKEVVRLEVIMVCEKTVFSRGFATTQVIKMGRQFAGEKRLPLLYTAMTYPVFLSKGMSPMATDWLKTRHKNCLHRCFVFFKSLELMLSIPANVDSLRFSIRLVIPVKETDALRERVNKIGDKRQRQRFFKCEDWDKKKSR